MGECVGFQAQIASVIELLANSAVAEICKLMDDGYAVLRSQMALERQKVEKENRVLRQKLREMDVKMRSYERRMKRRNLREEMLHGAHFRPAEGKQVEMTGAQTCFRQTASEGARRGARTHRASRTQRPPGHRQDLC